MKKYEAVFTIIYYVFVLVAALISSIIEFNLVVVYLAVIAIVLGLFVQSIERRISNKIDKNLSTITQVDFIYEEEFYSKFKQLVSQASISVDITHLGLSPPMTRENTQQGDYYKDFADLCRKSRANVRRVERISKEKIEWIESLINKVEGVVNFSLYCILDLNVRPNEMSESISVQRVDEHLFLIALTEHRSTSKPRDIYIRSKQLNEYFKNYYETRLVQSATLIIKDGRLFKEEWEKMKGKII